MDPLKDFAVSTLAEGVAIDATSATIATGEGARFSTGGEFTAAVWNYTDFGDNTLAAVYAGKFEYWRVTRSTDALTIVTRGAHGTTAIAHNTEGKTYRIAQVLNAALIDQLAPKANPTFTNTTTVESLVITKGITIAPAPMDALEIDINEQNNTKDLATNSTLTFSATPTTGMVFGATLTETSGSDITVEIPECYSVNQGGLIAEFVLLANSIAELGFRHDGSKVIVTGDPRTPAQDRTALGLAAIAASGSAADLTTGVLAPARIAAGGTPLQVARINAAGTALEFAAETGGGGGSSGGTFSLDDGDGTTAVSSASFDDGDGTTA